MESHSINRAQHKEKVSHDSKKIISKSIVDPALQATVAIAKASSSSALEVAQRVSHSQELSPALEALLAIAKARYSAYKETAQRFDDSQEKFSSKMENLLNGFDLIARASLRTVHTTQNQ